MPVPSPSLPSSMSSRLSALPKSGLRRVLSSPLAAALAYPHSVDHYLELVSPLWSVDHIRAQVVQVVRETRDVVTLVLRPNSNFPGYRAGQYVAVTLEIEGTRHTRCFSLSSSPLRRDGLITLTIKARADGGLVSPFVQQARPGLRVTLSEPQGDFVLPGDLPEQLLFVSGGSGITPCMSMLRTLLTGGYLGRIVFLHYARSPEDIIFGRELHTLADTHTNLALSIETESERGAPPCLDEESLAALIPDFESWDCWVCGPQPLMDAAQRLYATRDAPARVRSEQFVRATPGVRSPDAPTGELRFARSGKHVRADARSLLEQAEAAGLQPRSGCRMGICQSCRCKKLSGVTQDMQTGELSAEDDVHIRICVSAPVGDVALDL